MYGRRRRLQIETANRTGLSYRLNIEFTNAIAIVPFLNFLFKALNGSGIVPGRIRFYSLAAPARGPFGPASRDTRYMARYSLD